MCWVDSTATQQYAWVAGGGREYLSPAPAQPYSVLLVAVAIAQRLAGRVASNRIHREVLTEILTFHV